MNVMNMNPVLSDEQYLQYQKRLRVFTEWAPMTAIRSLKTNNLIRTLVGAEVDPTDENICYLRRMVDNAIFKFFFTKANFVRPVGDEYEEYLLWSARRDSERIE